MSGARESYGDQLYGIYEIDEAGNYQNTGITDFITENKILNPDDFEFVYADGKQAVYIMMEKSFIYIMLLLQKFMTFTIQIMLISSGMGGLIH